MKAAVVSRYGSPDVLEIQDVPAPVPGDNEVLVRIHASTVCYGDRVIRTGPPLVRLLGGLRRPKVRIFGAEFAGTVEACGKAVTQFAVGDRVFGSRGDKFGGNAEFATVREDGFLALKPANMTFEEAATVFVGGACSLYFLRKARIGPGDRVLIHGASGSLGTFAVQLAKNFGAHVTGVCSAANAELVAALGADEVIDYTREDILAGGRRYDVICDVLGKADFPRSLQALKAGGRYLLVGMPVDSVWEVTRAMLSGMWAHLRGKARFLAGPAAPVQADLVFLKELIEAGKLRTVIGRRYSLRDIADAHRYADTGHKVGNVVVVIADAPA